MPVGFSGPRLQFQEYFSGGGVLTEVAGSMGFQAAPGLDIITGTDLRDANVVAREVKGASSVAWGHFAPVCTAYSSSVFWSGGTRSRSLAGKDAAWLKIAVAIMLGGGAVTIENPQRSLIWGTRKMRKLAWVEHAQARLGGACANPLKWKRRKRARRTIAERERRRLLHPALEDA